MSDMVRDALAEQVRRLEPCPVCGQRGSWSRNSLDGYINGFGPPNSYAMETRLNALEGTVDLLRQRLDRVSALQNTETPYTYGPPPEWKP